MLFDGGKLGSAFDHSQVVGFEHFICQMVFDHAHVARRRPESSQEIWINEKAAVGSEVPFGGVEVDTPITVCQYVALF